MNQYLSRLKDSVFFVLCNYFGQKSLNMLLLRAILWLNRGISFVFCFSLIDAPPPLLSNSIVPSWGEIGAPHVANRKSPREEKTFLTEGRKNSSDLSFDSSEVSFRPYVENDFSSRGDFRFATWRLSRTRDAHRQIRYSSSVY